MTDLFKGAVRNGGCPLLWVVLYVVGGRMDPLLFHSLVEMIGVVIAAAVFIVVWQGRDLGLDTFFVVIGVAYGSLAVLGLLHVLAYDRIGVAAGRGPEVAVQLATAARYMHCASFVLACALLGRRVPKGAILAGYALVTGAVALAVQGTDVLPACFSIGTGFSDFALFSRLAASLLLALCAVWLVMRREVFERRVLAFMVGSLALHVLSEIAMTRYALIGDQDFLMGHLLKLPAFCLIYQGVVQTGLRTPHQLLFRELAEREAELQTHREGLVRLVEERTEQLGQANEKLREEMARREELAALNAAILDTIPSALLVLDAEFRVVGANRQEMEGCALGEQLASGRYPHVTEVLSPQFVARAGLLERIEGAVRSGEADEALAVPHRASDHDRQRHGDRYLDVRVMALPGDARTGPRQPYAMVALTDSTRRRQLEERSRERSKLESIGTLAGGVAHDFNNVLTGILGYTAVMLRDGLGEEDRRDFLMGVHELAERATGLTRQLLIFSRQDRVAPTRLDVNDGIRRMAETLRSVLGETRELRLELASDLADVLADPLHVEQIVMNLVANSRDAMPDGGRATVETANVVLGEEYARQHVGSAPGPHVMIAVSDTGHGMDEATRERIFEPFFTTKEVGRGPGLGLATVYGIVARHGGSIVVQSEVGVGSTFRVYLPAAGTTCEDRECAAGAHDGEGEPVAIAEPQWVARELQV